MRRARKEELNKISEFLVEQFWGKEELGIVFIGIDPEKARKLSIEFLCLVLKYFYKHGDIFVYDENITGVMAGVDQKKKSFIYRLPLIIGAGMLFTKGFSKEETKIMNENEKTIAEVSNKNWFKKHCQESPYQLAEFAIEKNARGKGICREMLEYLFDHVKTFKSSIILETHTKENVPLYEHFGFSLMETHESKNKQFTQYRMRKPLSP